MNFSKTAISLVPVRKRLKTENGKRKTEKPKATLRGHCEERSNLEAITSNANGGEAPRSGQTGLLRRKELRRPRNRKWRTAQPFCVRPTPIEVASETGPLSAILGKRVVVVADAQNLDLGARDLGFKMSWALLAEKIDAAAAWASRHAILSQQPGDERRMNYLDERDWSPHATTIRTVSTRKGLERKGNADFLLAFLAGVVVSRASADVVVIASGDGDLVEEIAIGIRSLRKVCTTT